MLFLFWSESTYLAVRTAMLASGVLPWDILAGLLLMCRRARHLSLICTHLSSPVYNDVSPELLRSFIPTTLTCLLYTCMCPHSSRIYWWCVSMLFFSGFIGLAGCCSNAIYKATMAQGSCSRLPWLRRRAYCTRPQSSRMLPWMLMGTCTSLTPETTEYAASHPRCVGRWNLGRGCRARVRARVRFR